ncbi:MAG: hypothetical protein V4543_15305 [Bacteroidota bacterium]
MLKEYEPEQRWQMAAAVLAKLSDSSPDLQGALFLVGIQELGQGVRDFTKEEKQDLMHIAICRLLSSAGYYTLIGHDEGGWPLWEPIKTMPLLSLKEQDTMLKILVADYLAELGYDTGAPLQH